MNWEETATDRNYPVHAFPMDSSYSLVSNPTLDWIPPGPRPIFSRIGDETHADPLFSDVASNTSDIVTDDLTRPPSRKNELEVEPKKQIAKGRSTKMTVIVLFDTMRSNKQFRVFAVNIMSQWINSAYVSSRTPSFMNDLIDPTGLQVQFMHGIEEKRRKWHPVWHAYKGRIEYLRTEAQLDGFTVNDMSETDFWSFFKSMPFLRKAGVILMDNGNLRAVWRDEHKNRLGLQFLGDQSVEYVIFKRRVGAKEVSRAAGFDTLNGFKKQIHAFNLKGLVYT